ncbi:MAG: NrfD/PsrC family molybdoenzyme membrane anchor subunit [Armatimonadota bacterium]|nr:NrfD/PsrC family molybdoenzyme membrane anchor subunit [Armatimonadota bacterium]
MATRVERLPYGIGRFTLGLYLLLVVLLMVVGWGIYAYSRQFTEGLVVTGLRDIGTMGGAAWGLYIAFDIYFVGVSFAGITTAALIRLLHLKHLKPVSRMAEVLTVVSLILAAFSVLPDLGQPVRGIINLFRYARPQSPFFGTFTLVVSGYLFASLVYLYLDGRRDAAILAKEKGPLQGFYRLWAAGYRDTPAERERHDRASFWLAIAILPLLVTAHSTLGFVFGIQSGRPGWFSALQAPGFVVMAGVSGIGLLAVIAAILRQALNEREQLHEGIFKWLGMFLVVLILIYLYFMVVELLTTTYAGHHHEVRVTLALLTGGYAWLFWGVVASLLLALVSLLLPYLPEPLRVRFPAFQPGYALATGLTAFVVGVFFILQRMGPPRGALLMLSPEVLRWIPWLLAVFLVLFVLSFFPLFTTSFVASAAVSGLLVNLAAIGKRLLIVVPSQTYGTLLPYGVGTYTPTWVEYSIIGGLFALGTLLYLLFVKFFPIMEVRTAEEGGH